MPQVCHAPAPAATHLGPPDRGAAPGFGWFSGVPRKLGHTPENQPGPRGALRSGVGSCVAFASRAGLGS
ncbi:hypothetical protein Apa02nite_003750 [Actinoplanes palleronii]|uniref:Uncharacterized protein n=1 Tax=Actinoplanes palleronii TaxID=113570 RepID=A0ABQ4B0R8_9ACTN|nr:hypothetical protein Apa02nite_003750 [Actinoplanes palleronii]